MAHHGKAAVHRGGLHALLEAPGPEQGGRPAVDVGQADRARQPDDGLERLLLEVGAPVARPARIEVIRREFRQRGVLLPGVAARQLVAQVAPLALRDGGPDPRVKALGHRAVGHLAPEAPAVRPENR